MDHSFMGIVLAIIWIMGLGYITAKTLEGVNLKEFDQHTDRGKAFYVLGKFRVVFRGLTYLIWLAGVLAVLAYYNASEAHRHSHEAINTILEQHGQPPRYDDNGSRLEP